MTESQALATTGGKYFPRFQDRTSLLRTLLVTALGIGLGGGVSAGAEAQSYWLTNIGVITGAAYNSPRAIDDTSGVNRGTDNSPYTSEASTTTPPFAGLITTPNRGRR